MTQEQARKAAEVMLAYADGKTIECCSDNTIGWITIKNSPKFDWSNCLYRIKEEPTHRPFKDAEECWNEMLKHQPFGWLKHINSGDIFIIRHLDMLAVNTIKYTTALRELTFVDGAPFGIKEK